MEARKWIAGIILSILVLMSSTIFSVSMAASINAPVNIADSEQSLISKERHFPVTLKPVFVENYGFYNDPAVLYLTTGKVRVFLTEKTVKFNLPDSRSKNSYHDFKMDFIRCQKSELEPMGKLDGSVNYFQGNQKENWQTSLPTFSSVKYKSLYPGIDMLVKNSGLSLKYEFIVAPGSDPKKIKIKYTGIDALSLDDNGNLHIKVFSKEIVDSCPIAYQEVNGNKVNVEVNFKLTGKYSYRFVIGKYNKSLPLIIDPDLEWSTFLGGFEDEFGTDVAVDTSGNIYVAGFTNGDFPVTDNAYDEDYNGNTDVFIAKYTPDGKTLSYCTYLGGNGFDKPCWIKIADNNSLYIIGSTGSNDFPCEGAYDSSYNGYSDIFITKLDADGNTLLYSTYLGGNCDDSADDAFLDGNGIIYITGDTSANFPTTPGAYYAGQQTCSFYSSVFVTKFNPENEPNEQLLYSTCMGLGSRGRGISAYDGHIFMTGVGGFAPVKPCPGAYSCSHNSSDPLFIAEFNPEANEPNDQLVYCTYLGGGAEQDAMDLAIDESGDVYILTSCSYDSYSECPTCPAKNAYDYNHNSPNYGYDTVVSKFSLDAKGPNDLIYSTFLGGGGDDYPWAFDLSDGKVIVTGMTSSEDFPTSDLAYDRTLDCGDDDCSIFEDYDCFVAILSRDGSELMYSTYIGGSNQENRDNPDEHVNGITCDSSGNLYLTGSTCSSDFPTTPDAIDTIYDECHDSFVLKLHPRIHYYVQTGGDDCNSGLSWETAFATIQKALNVADKGDIIEVNEGIYYETLNFGNKEVTLTSKDPNNWDNVAATIIDANGLGNAISFEAGDANSILRGFAIQGGNYGIVCSTPNTVSPTIEKCIIRNNTNRGIYCFGPGAVPIITNNIIADNSSYGIYCNLFAAPIIKNNLIYNHQYGIITVMAGSVTIKNNTIVNNTDYGIRKSAGTAPIISNCIVWNCNDDLYNCSATYSCIQDGDGGTGNINLDPCFADADANDFHLQSVSPCIDVGDSGGSYTGEFDIDLENRVIDGNEDSSSIVDIGADEYKP